MSNDDLLEHAKSDKDFYGLLGEGVHEASTEKEISRAYRRSALKSHPDQNPDDPAAAERFHLLQIAYDVLSDPAAKGAYDNARAARRLRQKQDELLHGKRRAMKEDLERRESGALKRKRSDPNPEEKLEIEIRRLAADGQRRRLEREETLRREAELETEAKNQQKVGPTNHGQQDDLRPVGGINVPEISRTVKVRWARAGTGEGLGKDQLELLFKRFGNIEAAVVMPDRKMRLGDDRKKRKIATGVIIFSSIVGAHTAIENLKKQAGNEWRIFETIEWAEGKEPDFWQSNRVQESATEASSEPATQGRCTPRNRKPSCLGQESTPLIPQSASTAIFGTSNERTANGAGLRKVPSFASFKSVDGGTPFGSPFNKAPNSPSLEEITMIRLKNAEKKRLEEQIRKQEQENEQRQGSG